MRRIRFLTLPLSLLVGLSSCVGGGAGAGSGDEAGKSPKTARGKKNGNAKGGAKQKPRLPDGFFVKGRAKVVKRRLPPAAAWRWLESLARNQLLRAHSEAEDRLLTLEAGAVSVTDRQGARTVWPLPDGLRLQGGPIHLILKKELEVAVWKPDGIRIPAAPEITVARAQLGQGPESSLVVKEGRGFQTINSG